MPVPDDDQAPAAGGRPTRPATGRSHHGLFAGGAIIAVVVLVGAIALVWHPWQRRGTTTAATSSIAVSPPVLATSSATATLLPVAAPDPALANNPVVAATEPSVVKIRAIAPSCQKVLEGSGFVLAPDRVMTNAHVVAGANAVTVEASDNPYDATVVSYDPTVDIAILSVPNLPPGPLGFASAPVTSGTDALVMGYPGGDGFVATPARVREVIRLSGPDIYRNTTVNREVYTIRANVDQGNTGGPLIDLSGQVLGVVFGGAVADPDTGFVLTANEVASQLANIGSTTQVSAGACVS